ncbi:tryptophan halogenase family protein [Alteraurantiacibacter buctensis]|uniref:Tryptophan halogenase n=1 Tax=Alteraurantiacibacter buctensis TaxID=1503981 RepID=A0A844Z303_9SPHN|nr:tryptophan halogenase family protein [Alteraurantiacibacter buctensis]MXO73361.1 tryptophan halogenase [Alteraurantiacibacter buctensis]
MTQLAAHAYLPQVPSEQAVRRVLVVGGGSSGWMAATMLVTALSRHTAVELVESDAIGIVGVGEATIPPMQKFNRFCQIDERAFMAETHGTFKLGIEFHNWGRVGDKYLHQFGAVGREIDAVVRLHHWWQAGRLAAQRDGQPYPQFQELFVAQAAARDNRFAPAAHQASGYTHAYHFDASLYGRHLRKLAEGRGVRRHEGRIAHVERDGESGFVTAVLLDDGRRLEADLFIDCSGFASLLLGKALDEPFDDWSRYIPSDRALAVPSRRPDGPLRPYTHGIAHSVGWQWRIPLQHRTGNGHVFCSAFSSESEAEERLLATVEGETLDTPRLIRFTTGRRQRSWVGNVVALGLSSGFLEPLESTSIHFVQSSLERLVDLFPTRAMDPCLRDTYNRQTAREWTDVRDFIVAHYHLSERDDSEFWRHVRHMPIPDSLAHTIELWRARGILDVDGGHLFQLGSWSSVLIGQRCLPVGVHALADRAEPAYAARQIRQIADECTAAARRLPDHAAFVAGYCPSV